MTGLLHPDRVPGPPTNPSARASLLHAVLYACLALLPACHSGRARPAPAPAASAARFALSPQGSVRHWLIAGPRETRLEGPPGPDHELRRTALDYSTATPPSAAALGRPGPHGSPWRFHDPARNEFVEFSAFYPEPRVVEYHAVTEIVADEAGERSARLWTAGAADLWINDAHVARFNVTRSRHPDSRPLTLALRKGTNRLCVRLQCLGLRDMRMLFGLFLDDPAGLSVSMPGAARIARAEQWIDTVRAPGPGGLRSAFAAPLPVGVRPLGGPPLVWPAGERTLDFSGAYPFSLEIEASVDGAVLRRKIEIPANRPPARPVAEPRREAILDYMARPGLGDAPPPAWNAAILPVLARRLLGRTADHADAVAFSDAISLVDNRSDCADFALAGLLRLEMLGLAKPAESAEIRRAALAFRYWTDEPGTDGMAFGSENHSLLFHGCQLLAGLLYPEDIFGNSRRTGREQAAVAMPRILKWLEHAETRGFEEFNSGNYMPITIGAMLNVVDFSGDARLAARMSAQIDRILGDLALHCFAGGVITPQGRVYREVLFPETSGTQLLLALCVDGVDADLSTPRQDGLWATFLASSPRYRPPSDLAAKTRDPVSRVDRHADFLITLEKSPAYLLASLAVPAAPRDGERPQTDLRPGGAGYQQHLWQATIGPGCHVFVNHPGCFSDGAKTSRPGYWYGNGVLPRVRQEGGWLQAIHVIPGGSHSEPEITPQDWLWPAASSARPFAAHPIPFAHAYWPADAFDREERRGNWIFGQKGRGLVGLWCSEPLVPHDDVFSGRELRACSRASAWLVVCGDEAKERSLENFMASCEAREPSFDRDDFILSMKGVTPTRWWERPEPMPR